MNAVVDVVVPLFGVLLIGHIAARAGWFDEQATRGLSLFVFNFVIPPLLFRSMATTELPAAPPWGLLVAYYGGALIVFAAGMLVGRSRGRALPAQGVVGFCACFGNTVLMGVPLVLGVFGDAAALPLFLVIAVHGPLLMSLLTLIIEAGRGRRGAFAQVARGTLAGLTRNPIIVGLLLGIMTNLGGVTVPSPLLRIMDALAQAAMPCALFAMGAALSRYRIAGNLAEALALVALKNLAHPLLVWLLAVHVLALPDDWARVLTLIAALPSGVNGYLFAQRYGVGVATATTTIFLSTALSLATLSLLLALLR